MFTDSEQIENVCQDTNWVEFCPGRRIVPDWGWGRWARIDAANRQSHRRAEGMERVNGQNMNEIKVALRETRRTAK
jgi:hypothetical protein